MDLQKLSDEKLILKRKQASRIFNASYRKGLNYVKLIDIIESLIKELHNRNLKK